MQYWILIALCLWTNNILSAQKKIPVSDLLQDYDYLIELLKTEHQGLYYYTDSATANKYLDSLRASIKEPLTKEAFYLKVLAATAATNEGHTGAYLPKRYKKKYKKKSQFLPLEIQFAGKEAIVVGYFGEEATVLRRGDKLLGINGHSMSSIIKNFQQYLVTDGFNITSLYEWSSWDFSIYYYLFYGKANNFELEVVSFATQELQTITLAAIPATQIKAENNQWENLRVAEAFQVTQLEEGITYLQVPSFSSHKDFEGFYKEAFTKIKEWNTKHLILDIQHNGGGVEGNGNLLVSYLIKSSFQKYKAVVIKEALYQTKKKNRGYVEDGWRMKEGQPCRGDFSLQSDYYSDLEYKKPAKELIYEGPLYVLTSGLTFSGGAEFASMVKMNSRATFIGEEVGGAYEGNVSGYTKQVKLSYTKIGVNIPLIHFQMNVNPTIKGQGVVPDYNVINDQAAIVNGENAKLNFAIELITNKK